VSHESPRTKVLSVKLDRSLEVNDCLVMVSSKRVIVSDRAASLSPILIVVVKVKGQSGEFTVVLFDIQNI